MARRIPGEFVPSDVNLANDPSILRAGFRAELLFRRGNEYAKRMRRDGLLYAIELPIIGHGIPGNLATFASELVTYGLWETTPDGWFITRFLKWNLSQAEQEESRGQKRSGAAKTNHKRGAHRDEFDPECPTCKDEESARSSERYSARSSERLSVADGDARGRGQREEEEEESRGQRAESKPKSTASANKRGTRLAPDFIPAEQTRATILAECPSVDLMREHAKFVDYWIAQPSSKGIKVDWDAVWRNWMRRAGETSTRANGRQRETDDLFGRAMARANARDIAAGIQPTELLAIEGNVL